MAQQDDWWSDSPLAGKSLPNPPPSVRAKTTAQDNIAAGKYRDAADAADAVVRNARDFESRDRRFGTGATKAAIFGAMYPDTDGWLGGLKALGGAALRGTVGYAYGGQDHADYQYLNSRASALNNAALRMEKGVQTKSDEQRVARENVGVDKTPAVNHDIIASNLAAAAVAHARDTSSSQWLAEHGSLAGTRNDRGQTYEQWYAQDVAPRAAAQARPLPSAPPSVRKAPAGSGWGITKVN